MKVIPQSFTPCLGNGHVEDISEAAEICYQSEPHPDKEKFVRWLINREHNSTLEMSVVSLQVLCNTGEDIWDLLDSKYVETYLKQERRTMVCTASIRGWREFIKRYAGKSLALSLLGYLREKTQRDLLWEDLGEDRSRHVICDVDVESLPHDVAMKHIFQAIKIVTNRAVTHEIVRHRPASYLQESQRYCRYENDVVFIDPRGAFDFYRKPSEYSNWTLDMKDAEGSYLEALKNGASPQAARVKLPNSCKTEIIVYASLREWEHILAMRDSPEAEPSMREAIGPIRDWFIDNHQPYFSGGTWRRSVG